MKVRNGYVSNSSSSSFVIVGSTVLFKDWTPDNKYICVRRRDYGDGDDVFELTSDIVEWVKEYSNDTVFDLNFTTYRVTVDFNNYDEETPCNFTAHRGDAIVGLDKDYYSTGSIDAFIANYEDIFIQEMSETHMDGGKYLVVSEHKTGDGYANLICCFEDEHYNDIVIYINNADEYAKAKSHLKKYKLNFLHILLTENIPCPDDCVCKKAFYVYQRFDKVYKSIDEYLKK